MSKFSQNGQNAINFPCYTSEEIGGERKERVGYGKKDRRNVGKGWRGQNHGCRPSCRAACVKGQARRGLRRGFGAE